METHEHNEKPYDFCYLPLLTYITKNKIACLAQLVEHLPCKEKVTSSNLVTSIIVAPICIDSIPTYHIARYCIHSSVGRALDR